MAGRRASRNWEREYDESWDDPAMWVDNGGFAGAWNVDSWYDEQQRFAIIGKLLRPLSRRWRDKAERLEAARHEAAMVEARKLAVAAMQEMTPPDVRKLTDRLIRVEDAEELLRAFVIYDELWHFKDDHNEARQGRIPAHRITFDLFEQKWHQGWRPFDDDGRLVDDGT